MAMSPEAQKGYQRALKAALIRNGSVVEPHPSTYGWVEYGETVHLRQCGGSSEQTVEEDTWHEFLDTYHGSGAKHGLRLEQVTCNCGHLVGRAVRWEAELSEVTEAVFDAAFGLKPL